MAKKSKFFQRICSLFPLILLLSLAFSFTALGETKNYELAPNDTFVTRTINDSSELHVYAVDIPEGGLLEITFTDWTIDFVSVSLTCAQLRDVENFDAEKYYYTWITRFADGILIKDKPSAEVETRSLRAYLEAGRYLINIQSQNGCNGDYSVKAKFTPADNTEKEPNDTNATGMPLHSGMTVKGLISVPDRVDHYQLKVSNNKTVSIHFRNMMEDGAYIYLISPKKGCLLESYVEGGSEAHPTDLEWNIPLSPDTYTVRIANRHPNDFNGGTYTISFKETPVKTSAPKVAKLKKKRVRITWPKRPGATSYELRIKSSKGKVKYMTLPATTNSVWLKVARKQKYSISIRSYMCFTSTTLGYPIYTCTTWSKPIKFKTK